MTFPPCFPSYSTRSNFVGNSVPGSNRLFLDTMARHQQQQTRLFSTFADRQQYRQQHHPPMRPFEFRPATPELLPEEANKDTTPDLLPEETHEPTITSTRTNTTTPSNHQEDTMEGNAVRMLLELSKIVSKEISADSGCISREQNSNQDCVKEHQDRVGSNLNPTTIPKSIEFKREDFNPSLQVSTNTSSHENLAREPSHVVLGNTQDSLSLPPTTASSPNSGFQIFRGNSERISLRHRTVSVGCEDIIPEDKREHSPLFLPHASPLPSKDLGTSFDLAHASPPGPSSIQTSLRQHPLLLDRKELGNEAIRRALEGAVASGAVMVTPVPEKARPILSFSNPTTNTNIVPSIDTTTHRCLAFNDSNSNLDGMVHESCQQPLVAPHLLFQANNDSNKPKRPAKQTRKANKKQQPAHAPRPSKKKTQPNKKQARQKYSGKKFSWKAYPGKLTSSRLGRGKKRKKNHCLSPLFLYYIFSFDFNRTGRIFD